MADAVPPPINEQIALILREYQAIETWEERFSRIIALAKQLPAFPEAQRNDGNLVRGCSSQVWLHARLVGDRVYFDGDSDAVMVKGLVALLLRVYSGQHPADIASAPTAWIEQLGLNANLSPNRANGLASMVRQIKTYGQGFDFILKRGGPAA